MGLVDYASSSESEPPTSPPAKKRKPSQPSPSPSPSSRIRPQSSPLPPLPSAFHDLYAHTVRHSPTDDPALHQGRRRVIPHVPGNWPSHIYVEWIPTSSQHLLLATLLSRLQAALPDVKLDGFLTSELGAPLPLHVSLSRPFVLSTAEKDGFLERLTDKVRRAAIGRFTLRCSGGLEWHRTHESGRSFLVLRVRSRDGKGRDRRLTAGVGSRGDEAGDDGEGVDGLVNHNPELTVLLARCSTTVASYGQPKLYEWADDARVGDAFHVSIAWSFAEPDEDLRRKTAEVFAQPEFEDVIRQIEFEADGVKAKIGNVVNHIPLARESTRSRRLLGI